jgi:hypothetical protein
VAGEARCVQRLIARFALCEIGKSPAAGRGVLSRLAVARKLLTYRHQLVASPAYLGTREPPEKPQDLLRHRLIALTGEQLDLCPRQRTRSRDADVPTCAINERFCRFYTGASRRRRYR